MRGHGHVSGRTFCPSFLTFLFFLIRPHSLLMETRFYPGGRGAGVAIAVWVRGAYCRTTSTAAVAALVPRETILLVHVPDFNRTRDRWHHSDLYQLYREPAVQDFLRKPLTRLPKRDSASQTLQEIEQLDPKDAFFALTSSDKSNPRFVAGFRFRGSEQEAEGVIGKWRSKLLEKNPNAKRETIDYERHKIDTVAIAPFTFASSYDGHWFFLWRTILRS